MTGNQVDSAPAVANGIVYTFSDNKVWAFNATATSLCFVSTPIICPPLWTATTAEQSTFSSPAIENGVLFVGSFDQKLYAFDASGTVNCSGTPKNSAPLWTGTTGGEIESSPSPAGNTVFVGSDDGKLYAFGLP